MDGWALLDLLKHDPRTRHVPIIFLTAIITTVVTKWARDKCLKFFNHYHVTLERTRGATQVAVYVSIGQAF